MKRHYSVMLIVAAVVFMGVSGASPATQTTDRIETSARNSFVFITYLRDDSIKINTQNDSFVTLTGTVSEWFHSSLAEETVAGLPGVAHVENKLEIKGGRPVENSDAWINMKVKTMLMFHQNVSGLKTHVDVLDGVVTLQGEASSEAQKELTTEYAKYIEGVKSVKNDMTVAKTKKTAVDKVGDFIDDASITAQVKLALLLHRSTNVIKTKVETKNGIVTVKGIAKNNAEKDLVGRLVGDIKGVKGLKNGMTVGEVALK
jgi:hyperosmotically inducible periplasmic protein